MNINHKLMALGLAFSLLGSTTAFARSTLHFENGNHSYDKSTIKGHVLTAGQSGATGYAHRPSTNSDREWPGDMILG
jgi:hypothetical protein